MDPNSGDYLAMVYTAKGDYAAAIATLNDYIKRTGRSALTDLDMAFTLGKSGEKKKAEELLVGVLGQSGKTYVPSYSVARVYAALGQSRSALAYLEKTFEERAPQRIFLGVDPRLDPLRSEPQFQGLLRRAKLAP
jgi:tetratricopeptide (TPR) repeat protein